jgi:hypothetical protein
MSRYQNPYIYRAFELGFPAASQRTHWTLGDHWTQVSVAFWSNWIGHGARGEWREASRPVLEAGRWPEELLVADQGHNKQATIMHPTPPLPPPSPLKDPLGEFPSLRRICRVKPHRQRCPVAWAIPGSGELLPRSRGVVACCAATSPAHLSHRHLDLCPRLDRRYLFL